MRFFTLLILITAFNLTSLRASEDRWIDLEFDPIENASSYEIELFQKSEGQKLVLENYKSETPTWTKKVKPGKYFVRIRSLDKRNAPGPWSEEMFIPIKLPEVKILFPLNDAIIETNEEDISHKLNFEWMPVAGANFYKLNLYNREQKLLQSETVSTTVYPTYLNKRDTYFFEIIPLIDKNDEHTEKLSLNQFNLTYGKLPAPKPILKTSPSSVIISWKEVASDAQYKVKLIRIDSNESSAEKLITEKTIKNTELILNKKSVSEGTYKLFINAEKPGHQNSTTSQVVYEYEKDEIRVVVEKFTGIFDEEKRKVLKHTLSGFFSYPSLNYEFKNYENDTISKQQLNGNAFEINYNYKTNKTFVNYPISLNPQIRIMNLADNYASALFVKADALLLLEKKYNEKITLFPNVGFFLNKTPALVINRLNPNTANEENFISTGPAFGIKGEYRFNDQMVFKSQYQLRLNLLSISAMPENSQSPSLNHEFSIQAGYAFRTHLNLVFKGTYLNENVVSRPKVGGGSFASSSDQNKITNSGFLMSFGAEWFF